MKTKYLFLKPMLTTLFLCIIFFATHLNAQTLHDVKIKTNNESVTLEQVLKLIENSTKFTFTYNKETLPLTNKVQLNEGEHSLYEILYNLAKYFELTFHRISNQIVIKKAKEGEQNLVADEEYNTIEGKVIDAKTKEPLAFVSVYLSGTTIGTITNIEGMYRIRSVKPGEYNLVSALVGYSKVVQPVKISKGSNQRIDITLDEKPINAKEISVVGESPAEWQRRLKKFTKEFLGESSNAEDCKILNPEIIDFEINKDTDELKASAEDAIVIVNHSLGYKIKAFLKDFVWSRSGDDGKFQIYPLFEELQSTDEKEKNNWRINRLNAYKGSFRHFLKSCAEGNVYEKGFRLIKSNVDSRWIYSDRSDSLLRQKKIDVDSLLYHRIRKINEDEYCAVYDSLLQVVYLEKGEELNYKNYRERLNGNSSSYLSIRGFNLKGEKKDFTQIKPYQNSWVVFPSGKFFFNSKGICSDASPYGKKFAGYWAWKRVADLLPYDYNISLSDESSK